MNKSRRPTEQDLSFDSHWGYANKVEGDCVLEAFSNQLYWICELGSVLSAEQVDKLHRPYTWTVRQVLDHCACGERIFGDRMLRIAAGDPTDLPGWDENSYAESRYGLGNISHLITELGLLRQANLVLLGRIRPAAWDRVGSVDGHAMTPRGIAWLAAGHLQHHFEIIEKRCEVSVQRRPTG